MRLLAAAAAVVELDRINPHYTLAQSITGWYSAIYILRLGYGHHNSQQLLCCGFLILLERIFWTMQFSNLV